VVLGIPSVLYSHWSPCFYRFPLIDSLNEGSEFYHNLISLSSILVNIDSNSLQILCHKLDISLI
jgi:hypothetical protein